MCQLGRQQRTSSPSAWEKCLRCLRITAGDFSSLQKSYKAGGNRTENLLTSAKTPLTQPCWSSQEAKLLSQQISSLYSRTATKMKVKTEEDRRCNGRTHPGEEQQETHPGTPESFYEEETAFIRSHETLSTTAKAEYLTKYLTKYQVLNQEPEK